MCGIIGYKGNNKALPVLIDALKELEYRGYDSAGVAYLNDEVKIIKEVGRISKLESLLDLNTNTKIGIGHTRWATHGEVNTTNSHPHKVGTITLVHNGIIENYVELKNYLLEKGYLFKTETDTEVVCALIDYLYKKNNNMIKTLTEIKELVIGSYAFCILVDGDEKLYCTKKDSPLLIGLKENETFVASDIQAFLKHTNKYIVLSDNDIGEIDKGKFKIYNNSKIVKRSIKEYKEEFNLSDKKNYEHYMLKEINDEPIVIKKLIDSAIDKMPNLNIYKNIDIVACGSAYHASLIGKSLIEEFGDIPVNVEIASEYRYKKIMNKVNKLVILVSQSGETADTLACLRKAKSENIDTLSIVNVNNSSIAREAKQVLYLKVGKEIAVATTKAYSAQVTLLSLIALKLSNDLPKDLLSDIKKLPILMEELINRDYSKIANNLYKNENMFFIGRGIDYAIAMEASLKMKEISYIHSEAYAAGELKHGTISLIKKGIPVIGIITDENIALKTISNLKEVEVRGADIYTISNLIDFNTFNQNIKIPKVNKFIQPLLTVIPLQMIAYEVAKLRGCDIDKPKNLAKSVTVE